MPNALDDPSIESKPSISNKYMYQFSSQRGRVGDDVRVASTGQVVFASSAGVKQSIIKIALAGYRGNGTG